MDVKKLKRVFIMKGESGTDKVKLGDPSHLMSPEEVIDFYSNQYPKLQNSVVMPGLQRGDTMEFEIKDNFGPKG